MGIRELFLTGLRCDDGRMRIDPCQHPSGSFIHLGGHSIGKKLNDVMCGLRTQESRLSASGSNYRRHPGGEEAAFPDHIHTPHTTYYIPRHICNTKLCQRPAADTSRLASEHEKRWKQPGTEGDVARCIIFPRQLQLQAATSRLRRLVWRSPSPSLFVFGVWLPGWRCTIRDRQLTSQLPSSRFASHDGSWAHQENPVF